MYLQVMRSGWLGAQNRLLCPACATSASDSALLSSPETGPVQASFRSGCIGRHWDGTRSIYLLSGRKRSSRHSGSVLLLNVPWTLRAPHCCVIMIPVAGLLSRNQCDFAPIISIQHCIDRPCDTANNNNNINFTLLRLHVRLNLHHCVSS